MVDDTVVKAKKDAADERATASKMNYLMYRDSELMNSNVLERNNGHDGVEQNITLI